MKFSSGNVPQMTFNLIFQEWHRWRNYFLYIVSTQTHKICIHVPFLGNNQRNLYSIYTLAPKRVQRNFIKENIRNAKGCAQCIAEKRAAGATSPTGADVRRIFSKYPVLGYKPRTYTEKNE